MFGLSIVVLKKLINFVYRNLTSRRGARKTMKKGTYKVTENNGGGIALYCRDIEGNEFAHNGYECNDEQLLTDLKDFFENGDVSEWDGNDLTNEELIELYAESHGEEIDEDEDGNLVPMDLDVWMDDQYHETTKTILHGDVKQMTVEISNCGHNASNALKYIYLLFDLESYCPDIKITK